jgi:hypothetical protein
VGLWGVLVDDGWDGDVGDSFCEIFDFLTLLREEFSCDHNKRRSILFGSLMTDIGRNTVESRRIVLIRFEGLFHIMSLSMKVHFRRGKRETPHLTINQSPQDEHTVHNRISYCFVKDGICWIFCLLQMRQGNATNL